jgi:hypothetical protein
LSGTFSQHKSKEKRHVKQGNEEEMGRRLMKRSQIEEAMVLLKRARDKVRHYGRPSAINMLTSVINSLEDEVRR